MIQTKTIWAVGRGDGAFHYSRDTQGGSGLSHHKRFPVCLASLRLTQTAAAASAGVTPSESQPRPGRPGGTEMVTPESESVVT